MLSTWVRWGIATAKGLLSAAVFTAVSVVVPAIVAPELAHAGDVKITEAARGHFRRGVGFLQADGGPQYADAYLAFKEAYADSPSSKILGNLGLCATHLERDGEAIEAYEKYLKAAGAKSTREKKEIERDLKKLKDRVAYVRVKVTTAPFVVIDERVQSAATRVVNRYESDADEILLGVRAGEHVLRIEAEGFVAKSIDLTLEPGVQTTRRIDLQKVGTGEPAPPKPIDDGPEEPAGDASGWATPAWIGVALTGGLGIATGVLTGLAASNKGDYDDALATGDLAGAQTLFDDGQTLNTSADVLLGATIGAAAITTVFVILALTEEDGDADEVPAVEAWLSLGPSHAFVRGRF